MIHTEAVECRTGSCGVSQRIGIFWRGCKYYSLFSEMPLFPFTPISSTSSPLPRLLYLVSFTSSPLPRLMLHHFSCLNGIILSLQEFHQPCPKSRHAAKSSILTEFSQTLACHQRPVQLGLFRKSLPLLLPMP